MNFKLSRFEITLSISMVLTLVFALTQIMSDTNTISLQAQQNLANSAYANTLLQDSHSKKKSMELEQYTEPSKQRVQTSTTKTALQDVSADAYLVADIYTGAIYAKKSIDKQRPIASITKLLTALTASEVIKYDSRVEILAGSPIISSDYRSIHKGATIDATDLIFPLLMESNNAVAHSIAGHYGTSNFLDKMEQQAKAIGMSNTELADASGISAGNKSTAKDLLKLTRYMYNNSEFILNVTKLKSQSVISDIGTYNITNHNHFSDNPNFVGGKTGYTLAAKQTMLSIFNTNIDGKQHTIAIIILGSDKRRDDVLTLYNWFNKYAQTHQINNQLMAQDGVTRISGPDSSKTLPES